MQWTNNDKDRLKKLLHSGKTYTQASKIMGRSRGSISAFVSKHKVYFSTGQSHDPPNIIKRQKPKPDNTVIEHPPRDVPAPANCQYIPFIDIEPHQCRYLMTDFWDEPTHKSPCCGLPVHDKNSKTRARTHCTYHYKWSMENENEKNSR